MKLLCVEGSHYEMQYHYHLQSFIYNLLRGSKYHNLHNKEGYKFFCYSNIFPANDLQTGDIRTFIISSPDDGFTGYLHNAVSSLKEGVRIGAMRFRVQSSHLINIQIPDGLPFTLITGTPIVIRIPREKYRTYGIEPPKSYDYLYWRSHHPIELFMLQTKNNLLKKYNEFLNLKNNDIYDDTSSFPLFHKFQFKKQVSTRIMMKNSEQIVVGTVWEFGFEGWEDKKLVQFALDARLGERNSMGFGFMNLLENRRRT